jgi:hypothetical protein
MIEAPDGSTAAYDAERTRRTYADLDAVADNCNCAGCRNYRSAWKPEVFPTDLLAACGEIGIDPARAFETTAIAFESGVVLYTGELPFYGTVSNERLIIEESYPWVFSSHPYGTAKFSEDLATIEFSVRLPWLLGEPNPYAEIEPGR